MPGGTFEPFEVVAVPFPFTDRPVVKRRPALVISTRHFNDRHDDLILAMITSAKVSRWASDTAVSEWREAGLAVSCTVRLKIFTLGKSLILRRLGNLAAVDRLRVSAALGSSVSA